MNEIKSSTRKSFEQKKGQNAALFACAVSVVKEGREWFSWDPKIPLHTHTVQWPKKKQSGKLEKKNKTENSEG